MAVPSSDVRRPPAATDRCAAVDVLTGSRLHFGLLRTGRVAGVRYGGVGAMIDRPATWLRIGPSARLEVEGPGALRVREVARRWAATVAQPGLPPCRIDVRGRPPAHSGLGSGTQLALAVAAGLSAAFDRPLDSERMAADAAGRGERSAIGLHGFFSGGLLVESGQTDRDRVGRLRCRAEPPAEWRIVLARPAEQPASVSGEEERQRFERLAARSVDRALDRLVSDVMIPAVRQGDFDAFAAAVTRFNHDAGMLFADVQGGAYHGRAVAGLVELIGRLGTFGVGQSSWGPTVFACCRDADEAGWLVDRLRHSADVPADHLSISRFLRRGARIRTRVVT